MGNEKLEVSQDSEQLANPVTNSEIPESITKFQNKFSESRTNPELSENQSPESIPDKGCNSPQTIQTATEESKKVMSENSSEKISNNVLDRDSLSGNRALEKEETPQSMSPLSKVLNSSTGIENSKSNRNKPVIQTPKQHSQNTEIPDDIKEKLQQINIPPIERVRGAINKYHRSQILGAIDHVINTWETINDPKKIFFYQLPKQKVEQLGTRGKVYRASDEGGYTIERIKKMYPYNWRDAAKHFGVEVDE